MAYNDMTWLVGLWIDNDEGDYNYWAEVAQEIASESEADDILTREQRAKYDLAERMKDEFEERAEAFVGNTGLFCDMLGRAIGEVDWDKLAESRLEDVEWTEEEEVQS